MTAVANENWGPWVQHDNNGRPDGVDRATIVRCDLSGDVLIPLRADEVDWQHTGDPITRYQIQRVVN